MITVYSKTTVLWRPQQLNSVHLENLRLKAHGRLWSLRLLCCPNGGARTCDRLIATMKKSQHVPFQWRHDCRLKTVCTNETQIHGRGTTGENRSNLNLCNKRPFLAIVRFCANMSAIFSSNGVSPSNNTRSHIKCLIVLSGINPNSNFLYRILIKFPSTRALISP